MGAANHPHNCGECPVSSVPRDRVLLHVGVHKTGSTALQAALATARPELAKHGVIYPGSANAHHSAAWAVTERSFGFGDEAQPPDPRNWRRLSRRIRRHRGRAIVSSEFFGRMAPPDIRTVVAGLGGDRVHVLIAVRPLAELLPSSWQQYLKGGLTADYGEWLQAVLGPGRSQYTPAFWTRANFAKVIRRWSSVVPPARITAVVLDPDDRQLVDRTVAELVDIPAEVIANNYGGGASNRSLTAAEAELLRHINLMAAGSIGWKAYSENIRHGAIRTIVETRQPPADEPRINTPQWALDEALKRQRKDLRRLRRSGVDLRGPYRRLREPRTGADPVSITELPVDLAALGVASAAGWRP
jgi:hypothetical protein